MVEITEDESRPTHTARKIQRLLPLLTGKTLQQTSRSMPTTTQNEMLATGWYLPHLMELASKLAVYGNRPLARCSYVRKQDSDNRGCMSIIEADQSTCRIDLEFVNSVGPLLPDILCDSELPARGLKAYEMIDKLYAEGVGSTAIRSHLGTSIDHFVHQYPRMRNLELSASLGNFTTTIFRIFGRKI
ncbi:hypothetical protein GGR55DRAFT_634210 [Xylaria sp. FL0064]|nr:hypothetical protein GGR55DRAFT_634210 [Xylaria sp. FL0064]